MKKNFASSTSARATVSALFAIIGFTFVVVAILPSDSHSAQRRTSKNRQAAAVPTAAIAAISPAPIPATPDYIGFENFEPPAVLIPVFSSSQGSTPNTVEYMVNDAGEPSIGVNWTTNVTAFHLLFTIPFFTSNTSCTLPPPQTSCVNHQALP